MNNQYTKAAIRAAFLSQLNSKPFDKISVVDIARVAGVSRNTFYYWYDDIYALMDDLFFTEAEKIRQDSASFDSWADGFRHAVSFASENRKAIYHLYKSISRNKLESFLYEVTFNDVSKAVAAMGKETGALPEDVHDLAAFYSAALIGLVIRWLDGGMKEDSDAYLENIEELLGDNIVSALNRSARKKH